MPKKNVSPFFGPIDIAKNLMQVQQSKINRQIIGQERKPRRTMVAGIPVDNIIDQLVQEAPKNIMPNNPNMPQV
jgi:hypothetical protein